jgi:serine/threonine protein kinase
MSELPLAPGGPATELVPPEEIVPPLADLPDWFQLSAFAHDQCDSARTLPPDNERLPTIAGYALREVLGRGGMGVVYRAFDTRLKREVAIKLLSDRSLATTETRERFLEEAEAVARLRHPHVVQIYEIGETNGRPYLAFEYIEGGTLFSRLGGKPMPPKAAALLLIQVADAVQHAHEHGVIHRDLKPANILLPRSTNRRTIDGASPAMELEFVPKVTDFGVAKRLDGNRVTNPGIIIGTPEYMAPEQVADPDSVGPATDVWGLGATLYEMLTGRPPFVAAEALDVIEQVRRSEVLPVRRLNPAVPIDLETICLKCLQKDRSQRYQSAGALAEDLGRLVSGRPIKARPIGPIGRFVRSCRRNPIIASLTIALLLTIVGSLCSMAALLARATNNWRLAEERGRAATMQSQRAEASFRIARDALEKVMKIQDDPRFQKGPNEDIRKTLHQIEVAFYSDFVRQRAEDPRFQLERAQALIRLGTITDRVDSRERATSLFEEARQILLALIAQQPNEPLLDLELSRCEICLGRVYAHTNQIAESANMFVAVKNRMEAWARTIPNDPEFQVVVAEAWHESGNLAFSEDNRELAAAEWERARDIRESLVRSHPTDRDFANSLARSYNNLGLLYGDIPQRQFDAANLLRKGIIIRDRLAREFPTSPAYLCDLARLHSNLGNLLLRMQRNSMANGQPAIAVTLRMMGLAHLDHADTIRRRLAMEHPAVVEYRTEQAKGMLAMGNVYFDGGQFDKANENYNGAIAILRSLASAQPRVVWFQSAVSGAEYNQAIVLFRLQRWSDAEAMFNRVIEQRSRLIESQPKVTLHRTQLAKARNYLGLIYHLQHRYDDAENQYLLARTTWENLLTRNVDSPEFRAEFALVRVNQAAMMLTRDDNNKALEAVDRAITTLKPMLGKQSDARRYLRDAYAVRAVALTKTGRIEEAIMEWERAADLDDEQRRWEFEIGQAESRARSASPRAASDEIEALLPKLTAAGPYGLYQAARILVISSQSASKSDSAQYIDRALCLMDHARTSGLFRDAAVRRMMTADPDLEPLRSRPAYAELEWTIASETINHIATQLASFPR